MRLLLHLFGFVALSALITSCSKELSSEFNSSPVVIDASWEFAQNGTIYKGEFDTAYLGDQPTMQLATLEGSSNDGKPGSVVIQIIDERIAEGTFSSPDIYFQYSENGAVLFENIPYDPGFSITITHVDSLSITGTFSGTVQNQNGDQFTITDGKFTAAIKGLKDDDQPEPEKDYFPTAKSWIYQNAFDENEKLTITSTGTTVIDGQTYYVFFNNRTGEEKYYRKDGAGNYYEHVVFNFGFPVTTAPEIDFNILKEDATVGDYWDTDTFPVSVAGLTVDVKIRNTVTSKGDPFEINGVNYDDVIEVTTDIYSKSPLDTDFNINPDLSYTTLFGKGYGILFFKEKTDQTFWTLSSYSEN